MQKLLEEHGEGAFGLVWEDKVSQPWDLKAVSCQHSG